MYLSDAECSPLSVNSKIEIYDLTGDTDLVENGQHTIVTRDNRCHRNDNNMDCDHSDISLDSSLGSFQAPHEFQRYLFNDYDNGIIRQVYADFSLDRLALSPPMPKAPPPPPLPTDDACATPKTSHTTTSKRKSTSDSASSGDQLSMVFHMFQSPDLVQGDDDVSTPLPLATTTNPLITQVTFEDEAGCYGNQTPSHETGASSSPVFADSDGGDPIDGGDMTTVQPMQM
jgi:hypothetical protein